MPETRSRTEKPVRAILTGGLAAGTLDITYAILYYGSRGVRPVSILQSIASGLMGKAAYQGGGGTAIASGAAAVYWLASRKLAWMKGAGSHWWGLLYGAVVYGFMNAVVLPLSAFPGTRYDAITVVSGLLASSVCRSPPP